MSKYFLIWLLVTVPLILLINFYLIFAFDIKNVGISAAVGIVSSSIGIIVANKFSPKNKIHEN